MATILIIGANRGIGLALARIYQGRDDTVVAVCRTPSKELADLGVRIEPGIDVTKEDDVGALAKRLDDRSIDVLIHNAGILASNRLDGLDFDSVMKQFEVNAVGPLRTVAALRSKVKRGGKIGLLTSRMGSIADNTSGGSYGYRMSKAALNAAGVSLAHDLRSDEIAVVLLHPGYVRTDMTGGHGNVTPEESARMLIERLDQLDLSRSGAFLHANGEALPW